MKQATLLVFLAAAAAASSAGSSGNIRDLFSQRALHSTLPSMFPLRRLSIHVLTQSRGDRLNETLTSLRSAAQQHCAAFGIAAFEYVHIDVHVDAPAVTGGSAGVLRVIQTHKLGWRWGGFLMHTAQAHARQPALGGKTDPAQDRPHGILRQWTSVPPPAVPGTALLIVEDDVLLSPMALCGLKAMWGGARQQQVPLSHMNSTLAGVSLHTLGYNAHSGQKLGPAWCQRYGREPHLKAVHLNVSVGTIMSPIVSTWGFSPHPHLWDGFRRWLERQGAVSIEQLHGDRQGKVTGVHIPRLKALVLRAQRRLRGMQGKASAGGSACAAASAPDSSLTWALEDFERQRGHQIWSSVFHAFSVLSAPHHGPGKCPQPWSAHTAYPCISRPGDRKQRASAQMRGGASRIPLLLALHTQAGGVHHASERPQQSHSLQHLHVSPSQLLGGWPQGPPDMKHDEQLRALADGAVSALATQYVGWSGRALAGG